MKSHLRLNKAPLPGRRDVKRTVLDFAGKHNFVYFGDIDRLASDDIVRGATLSTGGKDAHYAVGSYKSYDVTFVERHQDATERLLIMQFDLRLAEERPHVFISLMDWGEHFYRQLFIKYPHLRPLNLGATASYDAAFLTSYHIYGVPAHQLAIERLFTPEVAALIGKHFGRAAIELNGRNLFLYSEAGRVTVSLLDAMLENGAWLAQKLDEAPLE